MVLVVDTEVISQPADTFGQESHLYFGGTGIARFVLVLSDYSLFGRGV